MSADRIVYREWESPIGTLIVGASRRGCCLLEFRDGEGPGGIETHLREGERRDVVRGTNDFIDQVAEELDAYFKGSLRTFSVPLDLRGTPFHLAVWGRLLEIPYGETRSYGEIARQIGRPRAVRAVGQANGANRIAIMVPCHRVIRQNGDLGGYGAGIWRKRRLLDLERGNGPRRS